MSNDTLESRIKCSQEEIGKARRDMEVTSLVLHFFGEYVGVLYYAMIRGAMIPFLKSTLNNSTTEFDYKKICLGIAIYSFVHIPGLMLRGLSQSPETNFELAKRSAYLYKENKKQKNYIQAWINRELGRIESYFSSRVNQFKYRYVIKNYVILRRQLSKIKK